MIVGAWSSLVKVSFFDRNRFLNTITIDVEIGFTLQAIYND